MNGRNLTLLTDLYQLTMAQGYWAEGKVDTEACFHAFYRDNPFGGGYAISCGTDQVAELVENFAFTDDDIAYLSTLTSSNGKRIFRSDFLAWLRDMELTVDVDAVPDGTVVFPREPLVRVIGPLVQCQILETALLNGINFQSLIATKAARICRAAQGRPISEFGLRRAQGPDGGMSASRAAYVGGCSSVANVLAGKTYHIPVSGTHAHSWVMSFDDEVSAFRAYADIAPNDCIFLVDTYDVEQGVKNAITVAREMEERGEHLMGIRIDSGDLAWLSRKARTMLDEAGFSQVKIVLSNDLNEYTIDSLVEQGACFDSLGVGTHLSTAYDQAALGGVYKLAAIREAGEKEWTPRIKLSEQTYKLTIPGVLDTRRYFNEDGKFAGDLIFCVDREVEGGAVAVDPLDSISRKRFEADQPFETMLQPLARHGRVCEDFDMSASTARERCAEQLSRVDETIKRFLNPHRYPCGLERGLSDARTQMVIEARGDGLF